jgi:hypothetical protein
MEIIEFNGFQHKLIVKINNKIHRYNAYSTDLFTVDNTYFEVYACIKYRLNLFPINDDFEQILFYSYMDLYNLAKLANENNKIKLMVVFIDQHDMDKRFIDFEQSFDYVNSIAMINRLVK